MFDLEIIIFYFETVLSLFTKYHLFPNEEETKLFNIFCGVQESFFQHRKSLFH